MGAMVLNLLSYPQGVRITKDTDGCLEFVKTYPHGRRISRDTDGCLGPKNLSTPIHRVDESLRTQMGAFVLKIIKPYPQGERINRDPDKPKSVH